MRTPANIAGHPIHPMLVAIPIGLWLFSLVSDLISMFVSQNPVWPTVALYTMVGGIVGALAAAVPGFIDFLSLPAGPKKTALIHMTLNLTVVGLYVVNAWWRTHGAQDQSGPVWLSLMTVAMLVVSGWLGGKMVYLHGVAVDSPAERGSAPKQRMGS